MILLSPLCTKKAMFHGNIPASHCIFCGALNLVCQKFREKGKKAEAILVIQGFTGVLSLHHVSLELKFQAVSRLPRHMSHTNRVCHVGVIAMCLYL